MTENIFKKKKTSADAIIKEEILAMLLNIDASISELPRSQQIEMIIAEMRKQKVPEEKIERMLKRAGVQLHDREHLQPRARQPGRRKCLHP